MAKYLRVVMASLFCLVSFAALANDDMRELSTDSLHSDSRSIRIYRHTPCNYWRFDSDVSGNICSFTERRVEVPDANDLIYVLRDMLSRIDALEARIKQLEAQD